MLGDLVISSIFFRVNILEEKHSYYCLIGSEVKKSYTGNHSCVNKFWDNWSRRALQLRLATKNLNSKLTQHAEEDFNILPDFVDR